MRISIEINDKSIGNDLYKQLLLIGTIIIYIRFIKDRSILICLINIINFGIISLINQILNNQYVIEEEEQEEENTGDIIHKTINKLFSNLQNLIIVQVFYSVWYHYNYMVSFEEGKIHYYRTIFLFLLDDQFPLNPNPLIFFLVLDIMLLLIQLILINIQLKRLHREHTTTTQNRANNIDIMGNSDTVIGFLTNDYGEDPATPITELENETQPLINESTSQRQQDSNTTTSSSILLDARSNNESYYDSTTTRSTTFEPLV